MGFERYIEIGNQADRFPPELWGDEAMSSVRVGTIAAWALNGGKGSIEDFLITPGPEDTVEQVTVPEK